jgi:tRNA A-37 threonylcarbamoyl transferase component Bud32
MAAEVSTINGQVMLHDPQIIPRITPQVFDPDWQSQQGHVQGTATGRGRAVFLTLAGHDLVLRPFCRGGLMGWINPDLYLRLGADRSRSFREYRLLEWMRGQGLPVPRPVAARYAPFGPLHRADLITLRIPDARPLADILHDRALPPATWATIGHTIRRMHDAGVDHTDLNCRNILLDGASEVWLIDFDKCRRRPPGTWAQDNLARLTRSLQKERLKQPQLHWSGADWPALLAGYERGPHG